jgi:hypothetical protein
MLCRLVSRTLSFRAALLLVVILFAARYSAHAQPNVVTTLAGSTSGFTDATGVAAQFAAPYGITSDGAGNLYVAEFGNHRIRRINIVTRAVTTVAGSGTAGSADGTGTAAQFNAPSGIVSDGAGNLYVADFFNHRIRRIVIATGVVTTLAGSTQGFVDNTGTAAQFNGPTGITTDGAGNLYIADQNNQSIRRVVIATGTVTTLAGSGTQGANNGTGAAAQFNYPTGLVSDGAGNLYIADQNNHSIRRIVIATGAVTTLAGSGTAGFADGTGTAAQFSQTNGITSDGAGNLYVADLGNHCIRQVVIATGVVTTVAGNGTIGTANGVGAAARFNRPTGLVADGVNNLYVADWLNHRIRALSTTAPSANFSGTAFPEAAANDGSITTTQDVTLSGEVWLPAGAFTAGMHFTAAGVPAGLTLAVNAVSTTVARISFMGNAAAHATVNSTAVTLNFTNAALAGGNAGGVTGLNPAVLNVNFTDPSATYSGTTFTEDASTNNGSITATQTITLSGNTWTAGVTAGAFFTAGTHYNATGIPAGLTFRLRKLSATQAEMSFTGSATTHAAMNNTSFNLTVFNAAVTTAPASVVVGLTPATLGITFLDPPPPPPPPVVLTITGFSPAVGGEGTVISIRGMNLRLTRSVSIGGQPATNLQVVGDTLVLATVNGGRTGQIQITSTEGFVAASQDIFTYIPPPVPQITSFGPNMGGYQTIVRIRGVNFRGAQAVFFGGFPALSFIVESDNLITATVGAGVAGTVDVTVVNANGRNGYFGFTYTTPPTPRIVSINAMTSTVSFPVSDDEVQLLVVATGVLLPGAQILVDSSAVTMQTIFGLSETYTLRIPAQAQRVGSSLFKIINPDGQTTSATLTMTSPAAPQILTLNPSVTTASFQAFTVGISGTGFFRAASIRINGMNSTSKRITSSTSASLAFTAEDNRRAGTFVLRLTNPDGQFTEATVRVQNPLAPQILNLSVRANPQANPQDASGGSILLVVDGKYFGSPAMVILSGVGLRVLSASATQLVAVIPRELRRVGATGAGQPATAPPAVVVVQNPDGQADGRRWYVEEPVEATMQTTTQATTQAQAGQAAHTDEEGMSNNVLRTASTLLAEQGVDVALYPNPTDGSFTVERVFSEATPVQVILRNALGQEVWNGRYLAQAGTWQQTVEVGLFPSGIYLLSVEAGQKLWREKVVKR